MKKYLKLTYLILFIPLIFIINLIIGEKIVIKFFENLGYSNIFFIYQNTLYIGSAVGDIVTLIILIVIYILIKRIKLFKVIIYFDRSLFFKKFKYNFPFLLLILLPSLIIKFSSNINISLFSIINIFLIIFIIPILEELIFRFFLLQGLINLLNKNNISIFISSILFAFVHCALHQFNIIQFIYILLLGIYLGYIYIKNKSVIETIIYHILFNLLGILIPIILVGVI